MGPARKSLPFVLSWFKQHLSVHPGEQWLIALMSWWEKAEFPIFSGKDKMATYFGRCLCFRCFLFVWFCFLSQMLKLDGWYYKFRFLADVLIQQKFTVQMSEWFWEKVRAPNYFGCWIYLCWVKRKCGVHRIEPKPRFLIISAFQYLPPVKVMDQYLNGNYLGEIWQV